MGRRARPQSLAAWIVQERAIHPLRAALISSAALSRAAALPCHRPTPHCTAFLDRCKRPRGEYRGAAFGLSTTRRTPRQEGLAFTTRYLSVASIQECRCYLQPPVLRGPATTGFTAPVRCSAFELCPCIQASRSVRHRVCPRSVASLVDNFNPERVAARSFQGQGGLSHQTAVTPPA